MSPSDSSVKQNNPNQSDDTSTNPVTTFGVRFEILLENPEETVQGKPILTQILQTLKNTQKNENTIEFLDVNLLPFPHDLEGVANEELSDKLSFEITGNNGQFLVFGMYIRSNMTLPEIKDQVFETFQQLNIYMKPFHADFYYGVHWITLGYLLEVHPNYGPLMKTTANISKLISEAIENDKDYWNDNLKNDLLKHLKDEYSIDDFDFEAEFVG